jgi:hypothetical protein
MLKSAKKAAWGGSKRANGQGGEASAKTAQRCPSGKDFFFFIFEEILT